MIKVTLVVIGRTPVTVEVNAGSTVLEALQAASIDTKTVSEMKSNGNVVSLSQTLSADTSILVQFGKIQGGVEGVDGTAPTADYVSLNLKVEVRETPKPESLVAYPAGNLLEVGQAAGIDLNRLSHIEDGQGNIVTMGSEAVDGSTYTYVLKA